MDRRRVCRQQAGPSRPQAAPVCPRVPASIRRFQASRGVIAAARYQPRAKPASSTAYPAAVSFATSSSATPPPPPSRGQTCQREMPSRARLTPAAQPAHPDGGFKEQHLDLRERHADSSPAPTAPPRAPPEDHPPDQTPTPPGVTDPPPDSSARPDQDQDQDKRHAPIVAEVANHASPPGAGPPAPRNLHPPGTIWPSSSGQAQARQPTRR